MAEAQEGAPHSYPYDPLEGLHDEALELLEASTKDGELHIPTFARRVLEELGAVGLLHVTDADPPPNVRKVKVGEAQEVWVRFDTRRDREGYVAVDVVDAPRSDAAILAAMIAYLAEPLDFERLLEAARFLSPFNASLRV
jgi:hypothetical protein